MELVSVKTTDNIELSGLISNSENRENIIIHIHGMASDFYTNSFYYPMHEHYPKNNYAFLATENRGIHIIKSLGQVKAIGNAYEKFEESIYDIDAWINFATQEGYKNVWLQGHSLGTVKIAYYAANSDNNLLKGLLLLSPSEMIGLVHDADGYQDHKVLYPEALELIKTNQQNNLLSHKLWKVLLLSAQTYLNLFDDNAATGVFNYRLPKESWKIVENIKVPVLAITGTKDDGIYPVMNPIEAMKLLENKLIKSPKVKTIVYENAEHDFVDFEENIVHDAISFLTG